MSNKEYEFLKFPPGARNLAKEIDIFITNYLDFNLISVDGTEGIPYKRNGARGGFAKLCTGRKCLILRFEQKGSNKGLEKQGQLDKELGYKYPRNKTDDNKYSNELFVKLEEIKNIDFIKPLIVESYYSKT